MRSGIVWVSARAHRGPTSGRLAVRAAVPGHNGSLVLSGYSPPVPEAVPATAGRVGAPPTLYAPNTGLGEVQSRCRCSDGWNGRSRRRRARRCRSAGCTSGTRRRPVPRDGRHAAVAPPPVAPPPPPARPVIHAAPRGQAGLAVATRDVMLREIRMRLQGEVVNAFDTLLDAQATDVRHEDRGDRRPDDRRQRLRRDPRRARAPRRRDGQRRHGLRAARAAPQRRVDHRGHGQRAEPDLHRARRQDRAGRQRLPERRARPADHRPDHHPDGPAHRRDEPAGRRPPARRLARQRDRRAAVARRPGHHRPEVLAHAVHGRRPDPVRHRDARDVRVPRRRASRRA